MTGRTKPKRLTESQVAAFREEGYVAPVRVLEEGDLDHYLACFDDFETRHGRVDRHKLRTKAHLLTPWINAFVRHDAILDAVEAETGMHARLSTSGGTSDARFVKDYCPVLEFGPTNATIHQTDERVSIDELKATQAVYGRILDAYFSSRS